MILLIAFTLSLAVAGIVAGFTLSGGSGAQAQDLAGQGYTGDTYLNNEEPFSPSRTLHEAIRDLTTELSLDVVLQKVVDLDRMTFSERQNLLRLLEERIIVEDGNVKVETIMPTRDDDGQLQQSS